VLGGAGAMAQVTIRDLLENSKVERVGVADLHPERAEAVARNLGDERAVPLSADARDSVQLGKIMKDWDAVINSTWYELNLRVMRAAISSGIHYLDLGGLYHMTKKQLELDKAAKDANVTCVLGIGSTPGTMNVMGAYVAGKMDEVETMKLRSGSTVVKGGEGFQVPYAIRTLLDEFTIPPIIFRDGRVLEIAPLSGKESFLLPEPIGMMEGCYTIHSELATMPFNIGKGIKNMDFIVAYPRQFTESIILLTQLGLTNKKSVKVREQEVAPYDVLTTVVDSLPKPVTPELDIDCQQVDAIGKRSGKPVRIWVDVVSVPNKHWNIGGGTVGTGTPPSIIAQWLASGRITLRGALPPELCVEPKAFLKELTSGNRGISVNERSEEIHYIS
jgi:saccharopine dehydrogenase-like NADP-dependent oxidoreductase